MGRIINDVFEIYVTGILSVSDQSTNDNGIATKAQMIMEKRLKTLSGKSDHIQKGMHSVHEVATTSRSNS